jgi:probable addiction module antidote protein
VKISELEKFDAADFLNDEEEVLYYLKVVLEENDPIALAEALGTIARSHVMRKISESSMTPKE